MFKSIKLFAVLGVAALVAACAPQDNYEYVVVDPEPISSEPQFTGKYK